MLKCEHCGEVFDESEATRIPEFVDDSHIAAFYTLACPFCNSEDIEDYYEMDDEE